MSNLNLNTISSLDTGREVDVNRVMQTVDYVGGLIIDSRDTVIVDGDDRYALTASTALPYTTSGAGMPEGGAFVSVGDAVLRQDLANPDKGAAMVARGVVAVDSIADLLALSEGQRKGGLQFTVASFHEGEIQGGGIFVWEVDKIKSSHDGGVVIDPDKNFPQDWTDRSDVSEWFTGDNIGHGVFVRSTLQWVTPECYGAGNHYHNDLAIQAAINANNVVIITTNLNISGTIEIPADKKLIGEGLGTLTAKAALNPAINFTGSNSEISGVIFEGENLMAVAVSSTSNDNIKVSGCTFKDTGISVRLAGTFGNYPDIYYSKNLKIVDCVSYNTGIESLTPILGVGGFGISSASQSLIDRCYVYDCQAKAISLGRCFESIVSNCIVDGFNYHYGSGFYGSRGKENLYLNNTATNGMNSGIKLSRSETKSVIRGGKYSLKNQVDGGYHKAVILQGTYSCTVEDLIIECATDSAIHVEDHIPQGGDPYTTASSIGNSVKNIDIHIYAANPNKQAARAVNFTKSVSVSNTCEDNALKDVRIFNSGGKSSIAVAVEGQIRPKIEGVKMYDCAKDYAIAVLGRSQKPYLNDIYVKQDGGRALNVTSAVTNLSVGSLIADLTNNAVGVSIAVSGFVSILDLQFIGGAATSGNLRVTAGDNPRLHISRMIETSEVIVNSLVSSTVDATIDELISSGVVTGATTTKTYSI